MDLSPHLSASRLAEGIRAGAFTSRDVLELYLDRCDGVGAGLNAVVTRDIDGARAAADRCDALLAEGRLIAPLHGLPMTVKDAFATRAMRSTSGLPEYAGDVPDSDAVAVARLRDAGAVVFGKTNVPSGITGQETGNELFGRTLNPWSAERTPGGSSGGAAAAVAAGLTALELGSDSGGSIRQPAHCCGVYGHVPTHGMVPLRGHRPQVPFDHPGKDVDLMDVGPLARSPDDLDLALDVLVGDDPANGSGMRFDLPPALPRKLSDYRVATWLDDPHCPTDAEVLDVLDATVSALAAAGADVRRTARPAFTLEEADEVAFACWVAASAARTDDEEFERLAKQAEVDDSSLVARRARAETMTHRDWLRLDERRRELQRRWTKLFSEVDLLLCPVIPVVAPPHDPTTDLGDLASVDHRIARTIDVNGRPRPYLDQLTWNIVIGLAGLPATSAPVGLAALSGLPVGVQIVGPRYADRTTIAFARALADVGGGFQPPPGY